MNNKMKVAMFSGAMFINLLSFAHADESLVNGIKEQRTLIDQKIKEWFFDSRTIEFGNLVNRKISGLAVEIKDDFIEGSERERSKFLYDKEIELKESYKELTE